MTSCTSVLVDARFRSNMPPRFQLPPGVTVLGLYRRILRNAKVFPSIKRDELVENIRLEFRENKSVTDPDKLAKCYETVSDAAFSSLFAMQLCHSTRCMGSNACRVVVPWRAVEQCQRSSHAACTRQTDAIVRGQAVRGVSQLEKYTRLDPRASNWELELEQDPLGPGPDQDDEDDRELGTAPSER